ncbi:MAG: electron transfer flavoprotein subunit alpha/FixB family protein, partial [Lachnospiraceae bacterium]|nr:electron transfer flavoprotein subunit alpha/FixB family protein [Lachnospiraceae bacterium]
MAFDNMKLEDFKGVWVFCEQREGKLMPTDLELISEGRKLADSLETELCGILLGDGVEGLAAELGGYGADKVIVLDNPAYAVYTTEAYTDAICQMVEKYKPEILLVGASNIGRDLGPRCAARLHTGLCADCTHLDVDTAVYQDFLANNSVLAPERIAGTDKALVMGEKKDVTKELKMTRPAFGGNLMATIICPRFRPSMATVRPGVLKKGQFDQAKADAVQVIKESVAVADIKAQVLEVVKEARKLVDLVGADYIVSIGRGIASDVEKGIALAEELADVLGGVVGGSRVAIDSGWLTADHQVGQTGKTVHPKVYIALGISGAIQHKAGMQDSELIIAVNK